MGNKFSHQQKSVQIAAVTGAVALASYILYKALTPAQKQQDEQQPATTKKPLARLDSQIDLDTPDTPMMKPAHLFDVQYLDTSAWENFNITSIGLSLKYPKNLKAKHVQFMVQFGSHISGLILIIMEKEFTREELLRIIKISGAPTKTETVITKESATTTSAGKKHDAYEYEFNTGMSSFYAFCIPAYGRTYMLQLEKTNLNAPKLEVAKAIASTIAIEEPQIKGTTSIQVKEHGVQMPLPNIFYLPKYTQDESDQILHVVDARKSSDMASSGIRIKVRKEKEVGAWFEARIAELQEFKPNDMGTISVGSTSGKGISYAKTIQNVPFNFFEIGLTNADKCYVATCYYRHDVPEAVFKTSALRCISAMQFVNNTTATLDAVLYQQHPFTIQVPSQLLAIAEHPLNDEVLVEFVQHFNAEHDYTTVVMTRKLKTKHDLASLEDMVVSEMQMQNNKFKDQFKTEFFVLEKKQTVEIQGRLALQIILSTFDPMSFEPVLSQSTYVLYGEDQFFLVQTSISKDIYSQHAQKEIDFVHQSFVLK